MADFVAVIRRAVDGLSDNTPEMRVKVYERARSAVQRQLENMKPRPPETMLARQLDKLDAAIREVEAEHAEAVTSPDAADDAAAAAAVEPVAEHLSEPPAPAPEPIVDTDDEPTGPVFGAQGGWHPAGEENHPVEDWQAPQPAAAEVPRVAASARADDAVVRVEDYPSQAAADIGYSVDEQRQQISEVPVETATAVSSERFVDEVQSEPLSADTGGRFDEVWTEPAAPVAEKIATPVTPRASVVTPVAPRAPAPLSAIDDPIFAQTFGGAAPAATRMPAATEALDWDPGQLDAPAPVKPAPRGDFDDVDLFSDVHGVAATPAPAPAAKQDEPGDGWRELRELAGYDKFAVDDVASTSSASPDLDQAVAARLQGKSFRMEPKPRRFGVRGLLLTLVGLAIVGGGAYAAWMNRTALNNMVNGMISSATKTASVIGKSATPAAETTKASAPATPAATPTAGAATQPAANNGKGTDVAALDNSENTVSTKFTQRLMANGSEVDAGPATAPGQPVSGEGKSIAQQNVASASPPAAGAPIRLGLLPQPLRPLSHPQPPQRQHRQRLSPRHRLQPLRRRTTLRRPLQRRPTRRRQRRLRSPTRQRRSALRKRCSSMRSGWDRPRQRQSKAR